MAIYTYKGIKNGSRLEGRIEAQSLQVAREQLRKDGFIVLELCMRASAAQASSGEGVPAAKPAERLMGRVLISKSRWELSLRQLATLLQAGVPILAAFHAVARQADPMLARVLARVIQKLRQGYSLQRSLNEEAPFLGKVSLGLIGVGEANGALDEMLSYAADLMEQARKVKGQIVQAFTYPAIVILGAMGVSYYMVAVVFPQVMVFIRKQGKAVVLPMPTRVLMQISDFMSIYGLYLFAAPFLLVAGYLLARKVQAAGEMFDRWILRIPLLGKAFLDHSNTMWCRTLGALLHSGVDIIAALDLVSATMGNLFYAQQFRLIREIVRQGRSLTDAMKTTQIHRMCPMAMTMISVSEESGGLDTSLFHVARYSEEHLSRRVSLLSKLVEPAIFVVVGGMVGFVYFAFFMAMLAVTRSAH